MVSQQSNKTQEGEDSKQTKPEEFILPEAKKLKLSKKSGFRKPLIMPIGITPGYRKKKFRRGYTASRGWARKLDIACIQTEVTKRNKYKLLKDEKSKIDVSAITKPLVKEYSEYLDTTTQLKTIDIVANNAAHEAIRKYNITEENLDNKRTLIKSYIQYALFLREVMGSKFLPVNKINLDGVIDETGELQFLKVLQLEAEMFGLEAKLEGDSYTFKKVVKQEAMKLLDSKKYDSYNGLYFLTRKLRKILKNSDLQPNFVYETFPRERRDDISKPITSLETALAIRKILNNATPEQMAEYGTDIGFYLLAKDVKSVTKENVSLPGLYDLLKTDEHMMSIMAHPNAKQKVSQVEWKHKHFAFSLDEIEQIIGFLRGKYQKNPENFFQRYGGRPGNYNLTSDLVKAQLFKGDTNKLYELTSHGLTLAKLLSISDSKFSEKWKPKQLNLDYEKVEKLFSHLLERYIQQPDNFFKVYGSRAAPIVLSKEFQVIYGMDVSPLEISSLISDGSFVSELWGFDDRGFREAWDVKPVVISLYQAEEVIEFLRKKYDSDPASFFSVYGNRRCHLDKHLEKGTGVKIDRLSLETIVGEGNVLSLLLGVNDQRFASWRKI